MRASYAELEGWDTMIVRWNQSSIREFPGSLEMSRAAASYGERPFGRRDFNDIMVFTPLRSRTATWKFPSTSIVPFQVLLSHAKHTDFLGVSLQNLKPCDPELASHPFFPDEPLDMGTKSQR